MYDVIALGELLIDFTGSGANGRENPLFEANPGGAPCNVLAMLVRLGRRAAQGQGDVFADITEADMREWAGLFQPPEGPWRHVRF